MTVLVTRAQWGARPRKSGSNNLVANPSTTIHYEGEGWHWPWDHSTCDDKVRAMQNYHMDVRGWSDIAYNYLACPHDFLFEGRGWDHQSAANGYESANEQSFALQAMWGSAAGSKVPDNLKRALLFGIHLLQQHTSSRVIKGHRDWKSTECPGDELYAWIKAGCPAPGSPIPPSGEDMTTDASVRSIVKEELKTFFTDGNQGFEVVQAFSNFNAENLRQRIDDIGNFAANATDLVLKDDFTKLQNEVATVKELMNQQNTTLSAILNKLNGSTPS